MSESDFQELKARLSSNMKVLRWQKGLAQERFGFDVGVDRTLVSKIECEIVNLLLEILTKLACQLGVTVAELLSKDL